VTDVSDEEDKKKKKKKKRKSNEASDDGGHKGKKKGKKKKRPRVSVTFEIEEAPTVPTKEAIEILSDYLHPEFKVVVQQVYPKLPRKHIAEATTALLAVFDADVEIPLHFQMVALEGVLSVLKRSPKDVFAVAQTGFFLAMPIDIDALFSKCMDCAKLLLTKAPAAVTDAHTDVLQDMFQRDPGKMLVYLQDFVMNFNDVADGVGVVDLLIRFCGLVRDRPEGKMLLALLFDLLINSERYQAVRQMHALGVFAQYLGSELPTNVACAYSGLAHSAEILPPLGPEHCERIIRHMRDGILWPYAVALLSRLGNLPMIPPIVSGLAYRAPESRTAIATLVRLATVPDGVDLLVEYTDWFAAARTFPDETFRILLLLYQASTDKLVKRPGFATLLKDFVDSKDPFIFAAMATVLQQTPGHEAFLQDLQLVSFIFSLSQAVREINKEKYWVYFIITATRIAEMGYIQDLLVVIAELKKMVHAQALQQQILDLLAILIKYPECVTAIKNAKAIKNQVKALKADPALDQVEEILAALNDS
jgi:hypothetical protein